MSKSSPLACASCPVKDSAACMVLNAQEREHLASLGHHIEAERGDIIFSAGDANDKCATLVSGALKISHYDADGHEHIVSLVHPAGFVGELFAPALHHHVTALSKAKLCIFDRSQYEQAIEAHPALALALLRRTSENLMESRNLIELIGHRSASASIAGLIIAFAKAASHSPCDIAKQFDLPLSRGDIAGLLGIKIETVSRAIRQLDRKGLIKLDGSRGIIICDQVALEELTA